MKANVLKFVASMSLLLVTAVGVTLGATSASAAPSSISGGNSLSSGTLDSWSNFVIVDGTNPVNADGLLTSWSYFAQYSTSNPNNAAGKVELVIVKPGATFSGGATVVYVSDPSSPFSSSQTSGVVNLSIPGGVWVQAGDEVGLYFIGAAVVPFNGFYGKNDSGVTFFTAPNLQAPTAGSTLTFDQGYWPTGRMYSVAVSGITGAGCKDGGYKGLFLNQGACVSAFATQGLTPIGAPSK